MWTSTGPGTENESAFFVLNRISIFLETKKKRCPLGRRRRLFPVVPELFSHALLLRRVSVGVRIEDAFADATQTPALLDGLAFEAQPSWFPCLHIFGSRTARESTHRRCQKGSRGQSKKACLAPKSQRQRSKHKDPRNPQKAPGRAKTTRRGPLPGKHTTTAKLRRFYTKFGRVERGRTRRVVPGRWCLA